MEQFSQAEYDALVPRLQRAYEQGTLTVEEIRELIRQQSLAEALRKDARIVCPECGQSEYIEASQEEPGVYRCSTCDTDWDTN